MKGDNEKCSIEDDDCNNKNSISNHQVVPLVVPRTNDKIILPH